MTPGSSVLGTSPSMIRNPFHNVRCQIRELDTLSDEALSHPFGKFVVKR